MINWRIFLRYQYHAFLKNFLTMYQSHVGEPICLAHYEDLIAMGSKRLILLGNCGVLDQSIKDCGIIIPTMALRDEGASYHYAEPADTIEINPKYKEEFKY